MNIERPIIFNAEMVRAILEGRKTMTRRPVKPQPKIIHALYNDASIETNCIFRNGDQRIHCPYGQIGDRIYVRETWNYLNAPKINNKYKICYRATDEKFVTGSACGTIAKWRPSIHMPRWASRITLEITNVRVERVQEITEEESRLEGIVDGGCLNCGESEPCGCKNPKSDARDSFIYLWNSIYSEKYTWNSNPWVWVIEFKKIEQEVK